MALQRRSSVTTPLGDEVLLLQSMTGYEELGRPFRFELDLLTEVDDVKPTDVLGQLMTVHIETPDGGQRHLQGHCVRFARVARRGHFIVHRATLRPWLWLLTFATNCRIFQNKTVPDIIKQVFRDHGLSDFDEHLTQTYSAREYVVQFRESDFDFVSRLMEEVGIYYYFEHTADKHTLVLVDDTVSHSPMPNYDTVPYYPPHRRDEEHIDHWSNYAEVRSGGYTLDDYQFQTPRATLLADRVSAKEHEWAGLLRYEYPGGYCEAGEGKSLGRVRLEEHQADHEIFEGEADCRGLAAGHTFTLSEYPRDDQNKTYLVVSSNYQVATEHYASGGQAEAREFRCSLTAIRADQQFRTARTTPRPRIGPQTATVVGKGGEEIWTDEHGRVRLHFHWDRGGKANETNSCWVRVAQIWAGGNWGAQFIPRIGQEVVVDFLDGNPDRPIVVGSVYHGFNKPPYTLPQNQTQSGIKSQSTPGGNTSNANEIRFEDKKGQEDFYIQAERTQTTLVKGSQNTTVREHRDVTVELTDKLSARDGRQVIVGTLDRNYVDGRKETEIKGSYGIAATEEFLVISDTTELSASTSIVIRSGEQSVTITKAGEIVITGTKVTVNGVQEVTLESDMVVKIKAPTIEVVGETLIRLN
jgi:type VI secretion system secreted protein VgrG